MGCSAAEQRVVVDGNLVTSRGPGTALEFALTLVEQLYGSEKAKEVAVPMVVNDNVGSFMHAWDLGTECFLQQQKNWGNC